MRWRTEPSSHQGLRAQAIGEDRHGNVYWYFYGTRLYREANAKQPLFSSEYWEEEWRKQKKKKFEKPGKRPGRPKKIHQTTSNASAVRGPAKGSRLSQWTIVCSSPDEWRSFAHSFQSSPCPQERKLYQILVKDFLTQWQNEGQQLGGLDERMGEPRPPAPDPIPQAIPKKRGRRPKPATATGEPPRNTTIVQKRPRGGRGRRPPRLEAEEDHVTPEKNPDVLMEDDSPPATPDFKKDLHDKLQKVLDRVKIHREAWPFLQAVEEEYAPGYYQMIKEPIDVSVMQDKISEGIYNSYQELEQDFKAMVLNCEKYNGEDSDYTSMAYTLWRIFRKELRKYFGNNHEIDILSTEDSNSDDNAYQKKRKKKPSGLEAMEVLALAAQQALREYSSPEKDNNLQTILLPGQSNQNDNRDDQEDNPKSPELDNIPLSVLLNEEETSIEKINQLVADIGKTINNLQNQEGTLVIRSHGSPSQSPSSTTVIEVSSIPEGEENEEEEEYSDSQESTIQEVLSSTETTEQNGSETNLIEKNTNKNNEEANIITSSNEAEKSPNSMVPDSSMLIHQDIPLPSLNQINTFSQNDDLMAFQASMRGLPIYQDDEGMTFHVLQSAVPNYSTIQGIHNPQSLSPPTSLTLTGTGLSPMHINTFPDMPNIQPSSPISNLRISPPFSSVPTLPISPNQSRIANLQICSTQPRITSLQQFSNMTAGTPVQAFLTPQIYPMQSSNPMTSSLSGSTQNTIVTCASGGNLPRTVNTMTSAGNLQMMLPYNTNFSSMMGDKNIVLVEAPSKDCGVMPSLQDARSSINGLIYPRITPRPVSTYAISSNDFTHRVMAPIRHSSALPMVEVPQAFFRR